MAVKDFLQDGAVFDSDLYSSKYFGVSKNFTTLNKGKNIITLTPSQYIKRRSTISVEVIDSAGKPVRTTYNNTISPNGEYPIEVLVEEDTAPGRAVVWIAGIASVNFDTRERFSVRSNDVNIVWKGLADIKKEEITISPDDPDDILLSGDPSDVTVTVKSESIAYQSGSGDRHKQLQGTSTLEYFPTIESADTSPQIDFKEIYIGRDLADRSTTLEAGTGKSVKPQIDKQEQQLPIIKSADSQFDKNMIGGVLTVTPDLGPFITSAESSSVATNPPEEYSATIIRLINDTTVEVDNHFYYEVSQPNQRIVQKFVSDDYTIEYNEQKDVQDDQKVTDYVKLCFSNTETSNGKIDKVHVKAKPVGAIGQTVSLGTFEPEIQTKLQDESVYESDPIQGIQHKDVGRILNESDVTTYYDGIEAVRSKRLSTATVPTVYRTEAPRSLAQSSTDLYGAIIGQSPDDVDSVTIIQPKDTYTGRSVTGTQYKLTFDAFSKQITDQVPELEVYISGSNVQEALVNSNIGQLVTTLEGGANQRLLDNEVTFTAQQNSDTIKPIFVLKSGEWQLTNIKLVPHSEINNTPNEFCIRVPLDGLAVQKIGDEFILEIEFIGKNGKKLDYTFVSQGVILNQNTTIDEDLIINTYYSSPKLRDAITGSFNEASQSINDRIDFVSSSIDNRITNVSSSLSTDLIYSASFNEGSCILDLHQNSGACISTTIPLSDTVTDTRIVGLNYNTSSAVLTASRSDGQAFTTNLDGTYYRNIQYDSGSDSLWFFTHEESTKDSITGSYDVVYLTSSLFLDTFNDFTGSVNNQLSNIYNHTSSVNSFSSSVNTQLENIYGFTGSIEQFTGSINSYTESINNQLVDIYQHTGSINSYTESINNQLVDIYQHTGSINSYTESINNQLVDIYQHTGSVEASLDAIHIHTGSINTFTSSISSSVDTNTQNISDVSGSLIYSASYDVGSCLLSLHRHSDSDISTTIDNIYKFNQFFCRCQYSKHK